jgi:hypothetical protein
MRNNSNLTRRQPRAHVGLYPRLSISSLSIPIPSLYDMNVQSSIDPNTSPVDLCYGNGHGDSATRPSGDGCGDCGGDVGSVDTGSGDGCGDGGGGDG